MGETCLTLLTSLHTAQSRFLLDCTTRVDYQQKQCLLSFRIRGADGLHVIVGKLSPGGSFAVQRVVCVRFTGMSWNGERRRVPQ
jgi:hypothetical protein